MGGAFVPPPLFPFSCIRPPQRMSHLSPHRAERKRDSHDRDLGRTPFFCAEAKKLGVDPIVFSAVKELDAVEQFKTKAENLPLPSSSDAAGVQKLQQEIYKLRDEHGILRRQHQVAFDREVMVKAAQGSVRKYKGLIESLVLPEAATALGNALDVAEAKVGRPVTFSDEQGMGALATELAGSGIWASLGVTPGSNLAEHYAREDTEQTAHAVKEIENEKNAVMTAFSSTVQAQEVNIPKGDAVDLSNDSDYKALKAEVNKAAEKLSASWK